MAFKIKDENGKAISIGDLNRDAQYFWHGQTSFQLKRYSTPYWDSDESDPILASIKVRRDSIMDNWYERIGGSIHYSKAKTWEEVIDQLIKPFVDGGIPKEECLSDADLCKPYVDLIQNWAERGFLPEYCEN